MEKEEVKKLIDEGLKNIVKEITVVVLAQIKAEKTKILDFLRSMESNLKPHSIFAAVAMVADGVPNDKIETFIKDAALKDMASTMGM